PLLTVDDRAMRVFFRQHDGAHEVFAVALVQGVLQVAPVLADLLVLPGVGALIFRDAKICLAQDMRKTLQIESDRVPRHARTLLGATARVRKSQFFGPVAVLPPAAIKGMGGLAARKKPEVAA